MDLFYGHISGMDALARGLRNAARLLEVGPLLRTLGFRVRACARPAQHRAPAGGGSRSSGP